MSTAAKSAPPRGRAVVVGAGVVGMASALWLQRDGWSVLVCDPRAPGEGCSFGNAGIVAVNQVMPPFSAGLLAEIPRMLFDPTWTVSIRWRHLPRLTPWLIRFLKASRPRRVVETCRAMSGLLGDSMAAHRALLAAIGAEDLLRQQGWLAVYRRAKPSVRKELAVKRGWGVRAEELDGPEIRQLVPALGKDLEFGVLYPDCGHVLDPFAVVQAYARHFQAEGGKIARTKVNGFTVNDRRVAAVRTENGDRPADLVVLAAGAWSRGLAADLGTRIPLDTERGYHVTLPAPGVEVPMPVLAGDHRMSLTPMTPGLRIAGTAEFAGLDAPPNPARHAALIERGRTLFPELTADSHTSWMGHRPATPDSMPVIGRAPAADNAYLAFGHGHLGLTTGPATGRAIADLAAGRTASFDVTPFAAERFA